jgi:hypothetical protein
MDNTLLCTEGKLRVSANGCDIETADSAALGICTMYANEHTQANAARIVTAWNSHDELVVNLTRILDRIEEGGFQSNFPSAYQRAKECLSKYNLNHK